MWDFLPAALTVAGGLTSAFGAINAGNAAVDNGARIKAAQQFTAAQLTQQAGQDIAASQRTAANQAYQTKLLQSRAIAVAAAGGGGALDPTVVNLIGNIAREGSYRSSVAIYQGEEQARQLRLKAAAAEYEGDLAVASASDKQRAYETSAFGSVLTAGAGLFGKYGMGGPKAGGAWTSGYDLPMGGTQ